MVESPGIIDPVLLNGFWVFTGKIPTIEPEMEFIQMACCMIVADTMMDPFDPVLEIVNVAV